jgi:hypothetical protein
MRSTTGPSGRDSPIIASCRSRVSSAPDGGRSAIPTRKPPASTAAHATAGLARRRTPMAWAASAMTVAVATSDALAGWSDATW